MGGALLLAAAVGLLVCVGWYLTGALGIESFALRVLGRLPGRLGRARRGGRAPLGARMAESVVARRRPSPRSPRSRSCSTVGAGRGRGSSFRTGMERGARRPCRADAGDRGGRRRRLPRRRRVPHHAERLGRADVPRDASAPVGPAGSRRLRPRGKRSPSRREPARLRDRPLPGDGRSALRAVRRAPAVRRALGEPARGRPPRHAGSAFLARPPHTAASSSRRSQSSFSTAPSILNDLVVASFLLVRGGAPRRPLARGARRRKRRARPRPVDEVQRRARAAGRRRRGARPGRPHDGAPRAWSRAARACCSGRPGMSSISPRRARSTEGSGTPPARPPTTPSAPCSGPCGPSCSTSSTRRGCGARSSYVAVGVGAAMVVVGVILMRHAAPPRGARLPTAGCSSRSVPLVLRAVERPVSYAWRHFWFKIGHEGISLDHGDAWKVLGLPDTSLSWYGAAGGRRDPRRRGCRDRRRSARGAATRARFVLALAPLGARRRVRVHDRLRPVARHGSRCSPSASPAPRGAGRSVSGGCRSASPASASPRLPCRSSTRTRSPRGSACSSRRSPAPCGIATGSTR